MQKISLLQRPLDRAVRRRLRAVVPAVRDHQQATATATATRTDLRFRIRMDILWFAKGWLVCWLRVVRLLSLLYTFASDVKC
jgi:hypothetical protein